MCVGRNKNVDRHCYECLHGPIVVYFTLHSKCTYSLQLHFGCVLMAVPLLSPLYQIMSTACEVSCVMNCVCLVYPAFGCLFIEMSELILNLFLPTVNCKVRYEEDFIVRDIERFRHLEGKNPETKLSVTRMYINLTNLFNGDSVLSKFIQCKQLTRPQLRKVLPCAECSVAQKLRNKDQQNTWFYSQFILIITLYKFWTSLPLIIRK